MYHLEIKLSFPRVSPKEPGGRERGWGAIDEVPHSRKKDVSQKAGPCKRLFSPKNTFCSSHFLQDREEHGDNVFFRTACLPSTTVSPFEKGLKSAHMLNVCSDEGSCGGFADGRFLLHFRT